MIKKIGSQVKMHKISFYCFKFMSKLTVEFKILGKSITFSNYYTVASVVHKSKFIDRYFL
jgi:hypothetical protein